MKRNILLNFVCAGALALGGHAFAQAPGGGVQGQSNPASSQSQRPGVNNPMDTTNPTTQHVDDKKFVKDAAEGGLAEVELGKLALQKSSNDDVKQFAQKMVDDHSKANDQLKQVAEQDKIDVPTALDSKHQSKIDKLSKLSGDQFDKAYIKDQLKDHETDVTAFKAEADNGNDPNIKSFASTTLPMLQQHLDLVKNLNKSEKNKAKQQAGS